MSIKLVISGCAGRMGSRIAALALGDSMFSVAGALEAAGHRALGQDLGVWLGGQALGVRIASDAAEALRSADVLIEFTQPQATLEHLRLARQLKKATVIGTTGLSGQERAAIVEAARDIPIVFSPNMSVGVNLLFELAQLAAQRLGPAYDVEVIEAHHRAKRDAPSGTAKRLAEGLAASRKQPVERIPVHAIRAGDIVGDHTVIFAGPAERLELTHRAHSRDVFAQGALKAAQFVATQRPGLYDMSHVLRAS
ncbi:MAG: 4-hydroxy-tetrahydrodipicolinate reductase [Candidatus Omnitrophica bacterium]|nr:4-hydroxy-tetrahydrodipicolinate reductase [Candidatus Omnitrophota bacterium]